MMQENYEDFIKVLISIELGIEDKNVLNKVYNKYMENDDVNFIDDFNTPLNIPLLYTNYMFK